MTEASADLVDVWICRRGGMCAEGDARRIDALLADALVIVSTTDSGWRALYRHGGTGALWELSYPHSEMHGGGPRRLRALPITCADDWF